ncbi:MAG: hypothetical protein ACJ8IK_03490 [Burkholderiaceae bacterium]
MRDRNARREAPGNCAAGEKLPTRATQPCAPPEVGDEPFFLPVAFGRTQPHADLVVYSNLSKLYIATMQAQPAIRLDTRLWKNAAETNRRLLSHTP